MWYGPTFGFRRSVRTKRERRGERRGCAEEESNVNSYLADAKFLFEARRFHENRKTVRMSPPLRDAMFIAMASQMNRTPLRVQCHALDRDRQQDTRITSPTSRPRVSIIGVGDQESKPWNDHHNYQGAAMTGNKSVLVIGLDPTLIDFSQPGYAPGMTATKVLAGLKSSEEELRALGYSVQLCLTDFGETAAVVVRDCLDKQRFDCILIGAGVRANPSNFLLFEILINVVHEHAPRARICFNTLPSDTATAVQRWM